MTYNLFSTGVRTNFADSYTGASTATDTRDLRWTNATDAFRAEVDRYWDSRNRYEELYVDQNYRTVSGTRSQSADFVYTRSPVDMGLRICPVNPRVKHYKYLRVRVDDLIRWFAYGLDGAPDILKEYIFEVLYTSPQTISPRFKIIFNTGEETMWLEYRHGEMVEICIPDEQPEEKQMSLEELWG